MGSAKHIGPPRSVPRLTVNIDVSIKRYRAPAQRLVMADVSTAGALITGAFSGIVKGDEVILRLGERFLVATVVWIADSSFGLVFHKRMTDYELDTAIDPPTQSGVALGTRTIHPASLA